MRGLASLSVLLLSLLSTLSFADFQKGWDAYESGNYAAAFAEWKPLAEQGVVNAQYNLGLMYENGEGVTADRNASIKWYTLAAKQGSAKAQYKLGKWVSRNADINIYKKDYEAHKEIVMWYSLAADQGFITAQIELAMHYGFMSTLYEYRKYVPEMLQWYTRAAEQGDVSSQEALCIGYYKGFRSIQDYDAAFKWCTLGAESEHDSFSKETLGLMYYEGKGVTQDYIRAHMWFNVAAAANPRLASAIKNRSEVEEKMTPTQVGKAQKLARECLAKNYKNC